MHYNFSNEKEECIITSLMKKKMIQSISHQQSCKSPKQVSTIISKLENPHPRTPFSLFITNLLCSNSLTIVAHYQCRCQFPLMLLHVFHQLFHRPSNFFWEFCNLIFVKATNNVQAIQNVCQTSTTSFKTLKAATNPLSLKNKYTKFLASSTYYVHTLNKKKTCFNLSNLNIFIK